MVHVTDLARPICIDHDVVDSTQDQLRRWLDAVQAGTPIAVRARSQRAGRGRQGRRWQDPPGDALLLSVGVRGAPLGVLDELPRRVVDELLACTSGADRLAWKAPNDVVARASGAKVAGVLVDARTTGDRVDEVLIGIGCNVTGDPFRAVDGRDATTLAALDATLDVDALLAALGRLLSARS